MSYCRSILWGCFYGVFFAGGLVLAQNQPKIIGLMPVRNEENYVAQTLRALSLYTDAIVVLDDASDDSTVKIIEQLAQECRIQKIIKKETWYRDEPGDRNKLLLAGRELGGTHFICLDADEMVTSNCLEAGFLRKRILELNPGEKLTMVWILLWRDIHQYRFDTSVWTSNYGDPIFCDDGECFYLSDFIHTSRTPAGLKGEVKRIEGYAHGVLHFQFVNWRNLLIKQAWYRCLEKIRIPEKSVDEINQRYAPSKDETNLGVRISPVEWFSGYTFFDARDFNKPEGWREKQVVGWFDYYGKDYFSGLDIGDINWGEGLKK